MHIAEDLIIVIENLENYADQNHTKDRAKNTNWAAKFIENSKVIIQDRFKFSNIPLRFAIVKTLWKEIIFKNEMLHSTKTNQLIN